MTDDFSSAVRYLSAVALCSWRDLDEGGSLARYYLWFAEGFRLRYVAFALFDDSGKARSLAVIRPSETLKDYLNSAQGSANMWYVQPHDALNVVGDHVEEVYAAHEQQQAALQLQSQPQSQPQPNPHLPRPAHRPAPSPCWLGLAATSRPTGQSKVRRTGLLLTSVTG